jgi:hypothetical protein
MTMARTRRDPHRGRMPNVSVWISLFASLVVACTDELAPTNEPKHCVATGSVKLSPDDPGTTETARCYDTLSESVAAATGGLVEVADDATADDIERALAKLDRAGAVGPNILAIEYVAPRFDSFWGTWIASSFATCNTAWSIHFWNLSEHNFNDRISSAKIFAGCANAYHYEHAAMVGAWTLCRELSFDCYYNMQYMDDRTSSIAFSNNF